MASISNNSSQLYRITYESYSKFANSIGECTSIEQVGEVTVKHLKYLLNFHIIRIVLKQNDKFYFFSIAGKNLNAFFHQEIELLPYEKKLLKEGIPQRSNKIPKSFFSEEIDFEILKNPLLWAWKLEKDQNPILVSLISDDYKKFSHGDIEILKMATFSFQTKFQEMYLKKQLAKKNKRLSEAFETISHQNKKINQIVENQKQIIEERTREIRQKNEKLLHISSLNAHNVREPLSRIQGIIQLFDILEEDSYKQELVPRLKSSVKEMDDVLKEVIEMASKELVHLKAKI